MESLTIGHFQMRPMVESDLKMVLDWRNSGRIRNVMVNTIQITFEEHLAWYNHKKNERPCRYFIFYHKARPIGYIGYNDFVAGESCDPGMYIGEMDDVPANAGFAVFYFSTEYAFEYLNMKYIHSLVSSDNKKSVSGTEMLGFQHYPVNDVDIGGIRFLYYSLSKEQWGKKSASLRKWI